MAEEITSNLQDMEEVETPVQEEMDLVTDLPDESIVRESAADLPDMAENGGLKRGREEEDDGDEGGTKKPNLEKSVEEERLHKLENEEVGGEDRGGEEVKKTVEVEEIRKEETDPAAGKVGPKAFVSSVEMFEYFHKLLHDWPTNLDINKYEHMVLMDLLKKGHADAVKKIGGGIQAFQVRYHPSWKSKCFFLLRNDGSVDDFSFRKCVDHILPLPDNMKVSSASPNGKKAWGQHNGGGGGGGRGGGGRGGRGGRGRGSRGR
ncbi:uncharacterized protein LOC110028709 [Phalaenopsis equestris]|uniref:uncharacterized protein LOC110028709 n=1 Tax=Phalaenopsis equestris TaxID=78828 RepID=UPI0009E37A56|nr:uncharacterized protein LOC110028709 [Phalaenopsis equestris]